MTVDARPADGPAAAGRRLSLAQKFAIAFLGLVAAVLVINGAIDMIFTYREARTVAVRVQQEKADAAAERVVQFVTEIEQQLGWTTRAEWARVSLEQRRYDFIRLLRQAPAITELVHVDGTGREQLKLSRLEPDQVGSNADYSADPRFLNAIRDRIYYGPVTFRRGSEPYMTISMAHAGRNPGVTIADVNLKLAWDVVTAIRVGNTGYAFITDPAGRLIAHPDMSLVLRNTDLSSLPQVAAARSAGKDVPRVSAGIGPDGREVLSAYAMVPKVGWNVFVELPASEALGPVWSALYQTLALLALGVVLAGVAGTLLARRMVVPITELQAGAQKLGEGDLTQRIPVRTGDEIGALAARFNIMAGRIQEEQENLERKVDERTTDLNEALARQTATSDILRVISGSPTDVTPVFDAIVEAAVRLLRTDLAFVMRTDGRTVTPVAGATPAGPIGTMVPARLVDPDQHFPSRAIVSKSTLQFPDWSQIELPPHEQAIHERFGISSSLYLPLMRNDECLGVLTFACKLPRGFDLQEVALAESFRDQAMIAIENTRLFNETKEALVHQTGTSKILQVIAASPTDIKPVLLTVVESACQLCDAYDCAILLRQGEYLLFSAHHGPIPIGLEKWPINRNWTAGRAVIDRETIHVHDLRGPEGEEFTDGREFSIRMGHRTIASVPLLREGESIGALVVRRREVHPFTDKQLALLRTFTDQAVIAINNVHLFDQVQARTQELSQSLEDLRSAQDRLVQTEKLASLGQLTAGVAHEIKNPLNFVNNFADLSVDLVGEIEEALDTAGTALDPKIRAEIDEISGMLKGNLTKIVQHGRRADSIVKNMLAHSRESGGEQRVVDLNATVDEALSLAYHGARAEKPGFNITLERKYDPAAGQIGIYPQEFTRVLLNLVGNGFHAANKKRVDGAGAAFEPTLRVTTKAYPNKVKIKVRDNGTGMPEDVKARIFEPFFTTKPTGEGTGLGLSLSHDIIVKQHGGSIAVATQPGEFTEFTITLPRTAASQEASP